MKPTLRFLTSFVLVPALLWLLAVSHALADPPGRAGRLSLLEGDVAVRRVEGSQWERAGINWPLTTGDALATEGDGRAELRIGSTVLRLDRDTTLTFVRLDDDSIRVRIDEGAVHVRVRNSDPSAAVVLETADGVVTTGGPGVYRIEQVDGATVMSTYSGHLDYRSPTRQLGIGEDLRAVVSRWSERIEWGRPDRDDFHTWAQAREARDERLGEARHVSPEMTGAEDLYEYGDWDDHRDYGTVWYPREVGYDWAPYRFGSWIWVAPWGWTWVDDAPWGFAPFHYGRWVRIGSRWAWVPGRREVRPVYAPALVGWIGTGGAVVTLTSRTLDGMRWYPLAPREVYVPYYRYSPDYARQVNVTHITSVREITRVVEAPHRARHVYRDHRGAVNRVSESVLRPPRIVHFDSERRRERQIERAIARDLPYARGAERRGADVVPERVEERREWRHEYGDEWRGHERREERVEQRQRERADMRGPEPYGGAGTIYPEQRRDTRQFEAFQRQQMQERLDARREERRREQAEDERRQQEGREMRKEIQRREALQQEERVRRSEVQRAEQRQERREFRRAESEQRPRERPMQGASPSDGGRGRSRVHGVDDVSQMPDN